PTRIRNDELPRALDIPKYKFGPIGREAWRRISGCRHHFYRSAGNRDAPDRSRHLRISAGYRQATLRARERHGRGHADIKSLAVRSPPDVSDARWQRACHDGLVPAVDRNDNNTLPYAGGIVACKGNRFSVW